MSIVGRSRPKGLSSSMRSRGPPGVARPRGRLEPGPLRPRPSTRGPTRPKRNVSPGYDAYRHVASGPAWTRRRGDALHPILQAFPRRRFDTSDLVPSRSSDRCDAPDLDQALRCRKPVDAGVGPADECRPGPRRRRSEEGDLLLRDRELGEVASPPIADRTYCFPAQPPVAITHVVASTLPPWWWTITRSSPTTSIASTREPEKNVAPGLGSGPQGHQRRVGVDRRRRMVHHFEPVAVTPLRTGTPGTDGRLRRSTTARRPPRPARTGPP